MSSLVVEEKKKKKEKKIKSNDFIEEKSEEITPLKSLRCQKYDIDLVDSEEIIYKINSESNTENYFLISLIAILADIQSRVDPDSVTAALVEQYHGYIQSHSISSIVQDIENRIIKNNLDLKAYSHSHQLVGLVREELIKIYFALNLSPTPLHISKIRLKNKLLKGHRMKNSLLLLLGDMDSLHHIAKEGGVSTTWDKRQVTEHKDRVNYLFPISFQDVLTMKDKEKKWSKYFSGIVVNLLNESTSSSTFTTENLLEKYKMKIHYHLLECIFPYFIGLQTSLSEKSSPPTPIITNPLIKLFQFLQLNILLENYGFLVSIEIKSRKIVVDISGGKRELGETSLECGVRETFEELGFDFRHLLLNSSLRDGKEEGFEGELDWNLFDQVELDTMTCFLLLHQSASSIYRSLVNV